MKRPLVRRVLIVKRVLSRNRDRNNIFEHTQNHPNGSSELVDVFCGILWLNNTFGLPWFCFSRVCLCYKPHQIHAGFTLSDLHGEWIPEYTNITVSVFSVSSSMQSVLSFRGLVSICSQHTAMFLKSCLGLSPFWLSTSEDTMCKHDLQVLNGSCWC